jgi:hypothetical protein
MFVPLTRHTGVTEQELPAQGTLHGRPLSVLTGRPLTAWQQLPQQVSGEPAQRAMANSLEGSQMLGI